LISLAIQLGFVGKGVQVQGLLKSLALTFADEFIAQAETRAERLGSNLGVVSAVFYFLPFVVTVLVIVGVPLIQAISGYEPDDSPLRGCYAKRVVGVIIVESIVIVGFGQVVSNVVGIGYCLELRLLHEAAAYS
jgi:hypothetical protein